MNKLIHENTNTQKDNSKKIITHKYPKTIWISNPINYGVATAFNIGVKHAKGKYVLILNSDKEYILDLLSIKLIKSFLFKSSLFLFRS